MNLKKVRVRIGIIALGAAVALTPSVSAWASVQKTTHHKTHKAHHKPKKPTSSNSAYANTAAYKTAKSDWVGGKITTASTTLQEAVETSPPYAQAFSNAVMELQKIGPNLPGSSIYKTAVAALNKFFGTTNLNENLS